MGEARTAVVLVSGGLDSATVLAIAREAGFECHALSFAYGQRHAVELEAAARVVDRHGAASHRVMHIDLGAFGGSALTDRTIDVPETASDGIPVTYVPARNTVFLAFALGLAEVLGAGDIFIGVNAVDYSGYPDCRPEFLDAFARLAEVATKAGVEGRAPAILAPLLDCPKHRIVTEGTRLGVPFSRTVSCYAPTRDGLACGSCDACRLRRKGFLAAGVPDPTAYAPR